MEDFALTEQQDKQFQLLNQKLDELGKSIVDKSNDDRDSAKSLYKYIQTEIQRMEADYETRKTAWYELYHEAIQIQDNNLKAVALEKLGKPPFRREIDLVSYIEQLNKALEMSIKSSDNIVNLLNALTKLRSVKNVNVDVDKYEDNRQLILEEIVQDDKEILNNK